MLTAYQTAVENLLHDPSNQFFSLTNITTWINSARQQLAQDAECCRGVASFTTTAGQTVQALSAITSMPSGASQVVVPRILFYNGVPLEGRPWEWFSEFYLNQPGAVDGDPAVWSQLIIGSTGDIYFYPPATSGLTVYVDSVLLPIDLATDSDPELIPYPWTDAVPYFAAYLAFLSAQRTQDAQAMWQLYMAFARRGREITSPTTLPRNFPGDRGASASAIKKPLSLPGRSPG